MIRLEDLTPRQLEEATRTHSTILLPVGSIECHGEHNPIGTDTLIAVEICRRAAERTGCVVAPALFYGITGYLISRPEKGTMNVDSEAFYLYFKNAVREFWRIGFKKIFALCGHYDGGQLASMQRAASELMDEVAIEKWGCDYWDKLRPGVDVPLVKVFREDDFTKPEYRVDHGGWYETSLVLYFRPELPTTELVKVTPDVYHFDESQPMLSEASFEVGKEIADMAVEGLVREIREPLSFPWVKKDAESEPA